MSLPSPAVSVVIPIYNVEKYIERCVHSLFQQTLQNIEYIFVNDGSTDKSLVILNKVLKQYPKRKDQVKIINQKENRGVANARTLGILATTGDYIIHCDPDDYIELSAYQKLYEVALKTDAEITTCDFLLEETNNAKIYKVGIYKTPKDLLLNYFYENNTFPSLCNKLIKRDLIFKNNILPFLNCNYGEDFGCVIRFCFYGKTIAHVQEPLYHYNKHAGSITTSTFNYKYFFDRLEIVNKLLPLLKEKKYKLLVNTIKLNIKLKGRKFFKLKPLEWYDLYKESHNYILFIKNESLKTRIIWYFILFNKTFFKLLTKNQYLINKIF